MCAGDGIRDKKQNGKIKETDECDVSNNSNAIQSEGKKNQVSQQRRFA